MVSFPTNQNLCITKYYSIRQFPCLNLIVLTNNIYSTFSLIKTCELSILTSLIKTYLFTHSQEIGFLLSVKLCKLLEDDKYGQTCVKGPNILAIQTGGCLWPHESELSALLSFNNKQPPVNSDEWTVV